MAATTITSQPKAEIFLSYFPIIFFFINSYSQVLCRYFPKRKAVNPAMYDRKEKVIT